MRLGEQNDRWLHLLSNSPVLIPSKTWITSRIGIINFAFKRENLGLRIWKMIWSLGFPNGMPTPDRLLIPNPFINRSLGNVIHQKGCVYYICIFNNEKYIITWYFLFYILLPTSTHCMACCNRSQNQATFSVTIPAEQPIGWPVVARHWRMKPSWPPEKKELPAGAAKSAVTQPACALGTTWGSSESWWSDGMHRAKRCKKGLL